MNVAIIGLGNMGTALLGAFLRRGHSVVAVDCDDAKIAQIRRGEPTATEDGAADLIHKALRENKLIATADIAAAAKTDISFVGVQTPAVELDCDYTALRAVLAQLADVVPKQHTIVIASTLFPGAVQRECMPIVRGRCTLAYQPVFLRAGYGINDYLRPGKLIIGVDDPEQPPPSLVNFFIGLTPIYPRFVTFAEAEWIKVVHNAFMSLKVNFANEVGALAETTGVDPHRIIDITFSETAEGRLLTTSHMKPGPPYSGPCLPKDADILLGLLQRDDAYDDWLSTGTLAAIRESNLRHRERVIREWLAAGPQNGKLGIIGVAFRPGTNEMRGSLALDFIRAADRAGRDWIAYDPMLSGLSREQYVTACRRDAELETLHNRVTRTLSDVWRLSAVVTINRPLDETERNVITALPFAPRIVDLYQNKLPLKPTISIAKPAAPTRPTRIAPHATTI